MSLSNKQRNKIEFDTVVSRRLKEIQNIVNKELEIAFWTKEKITNKDMRADGVISNLNKEIVYSEGIIKKADESIDEYEKNKDKKGS